MITEENNMYQRLIHRYEDGTNRNWLYRESEEGRQNDFWGLGNDVYMLAVLEDAVSEDTGIMVRALESRADFLGEPGVYLETFKFDAGNGSCVDSKFYCGLSDMSRDTFEDKLRCDMNRYMSQYMSENQQPAEESFSTSSNDNIDLSESSMITENDSLLQRAIERYESGTNRN